MTDRMLSDLLDDAGSRIAVSPAPLPVILAEAAHRRRLRAASWFVAVTVTVVLVVVGGAIWLPGTSGGSGSQPGGGKPPAAGQPSADGRADVQVEVSRAEAERRCTIVWHNLYGPTDLTAELTLDDTGPWFEGDEPVLANWTEFDYGPFTEPLLWGDRCFIPQAGLENTAGTIELPLPASDDVAGVRAACGRFLGWDFSGWQVITADNGPNRLAAVLRSTDGYMANCRLDGRTFTPNGHLDLNSLNYDPENTLSVPWVEITTEAKLRGESSLGLDDYQIHPTWTLGCQREPPGQWEADCLAIGWVSGPEPAERIVITDVTGTQHEIPVVDRWFAFAATVINHADTTDSKGELHFTVYAADGTVLADYDEADMPLSP